MEKDIDDLDFLYLFFCFVKGVYKELEKVVYLEKSDVDENYKKII